MEMREMEEKTALVFGPVEMMHLPFDLVENSRMMVESNFLADDALVDNVWFHLIYTFLMVKVKLDKWKSSWKEDLQ